LSLPEKFSDAGMGWAEFDVGGPSLSVERTDPRDAEAEGLSGRFLGVSLSVDDVDETYEHLVSRGVKFLNPPARQPWGGVLAHFEDPEGNVITLLGTREDST
jgi:predicted enzyme related to lactoylglutathione lyase